MQVDQMPFNIDLLIPTAENLKTLRPVRVLDIMDGSSRNFHPDGLFSLETFGKIGTELRSRRFAYIDLKVKIFHPVIFKTLLDLKQLYGEILSGRSFAIWNPEVKDFEKSTPMDGETGFAFFLKHFDELQYEMRPSTKREFSIKLMQKYKDNCMFDKLIVMPAGLRDFEFDDQGKPSEDEINSLYRKVLSLSNLITPATLALNPESIDSIRHSLQIAVYDVYLYIKNLLEGKHKLILGKWAARRVFNGTRNVITSLNNDTDVLNSAKTVGYNQTVVGLYQYIKAALPVTTFQMRNGFLSKVFIGPNSPAILVNPKTLHKEMVQIDPKYYDDWMTEEGIEKLFSRYGEEDMRHLELTLGKYYLGLLYRDNDSYMLLQDIDDLPKELDKKNVKPLTFSELIYLSVYDGANEMPCFVTRYPISSFGSIYPSYVYLRTTVKGDMLKERNEQGEFTGKVCLEFPRRGQGFVNSVSPHGTKLQRLGADNM